MNPQPMAEGRNLLDPTLFAAFYQGEYDKDGNLLATPRTCYGRGNGNWSIARTRSASGTCRSTTSPRTTRSPYRPDMKPDEMGWSIA